MKEPRYPSVETRAAAVAGVSPGVLPPAAMASGSALAIPVPRSASPTSPATGASTSSAPPKPTPAKTAPARNTLTAPRLETSLSPTRRPSVTAPKKTPSPIAPKASVPPRASATYTADQFRPAPSASVKQKAKAPRKAMETDQPLNHCLKPPMLVAPSSDCSSFASTPEGKSRGQATRPPTTATMAQARKCGGGVAPRRAARAPAPAPRTPPRLCIACSPERTGRPMSRCTATPCAFIATSTTLFRTANDSRLAASTRRLGAKAGPNSAPENASSEPIEALRLPVRGTTRPPSWRPRTAPASKPRRAIVNCPSLRPKPSLMAGTREAQLADMTPVSRKQAAAPILARRARCSEICPVLMMQHSKDFRSLQQGGFSARRLRAARRLPKLRKELSAPAALFTLVRGRRILRTSPLRSSPKFAYQGRRSFHALSPHVFIPQSSG